MSQLEELEGALNTDLCQLDWAYGSDGSDEVVPWLGGPTLVSLVVLDRMSWALPPKPVTVLDTAVAASIGQASEGRDAVLEIVSA